MNTVSINGTSCHETSSSNESRSETGNGFLTNSSSSSSSQTRMKKKKKSSKKSAVGSTNAAAVDWEHNSSGNSASTSVCSVDKAYEQLSPTRF